MMYTILWIGLVLNALVHLRMAVLEIQDGVDRVKAGAARFSEVVTWTAGEGGFHVLARVVFSPLLTVYKIGKLLLFPRGIKSKFAKEQEAKAKAKAEAEAHALALQQLAEHEALVKAWAPGEILCAEQQQQFALGWHAAADVFDSAAELVARTAGQPWSPAPPVRARRIKVAVGRDEDMTTWNEIP